MRGDAVEDLLGGGPRDFALEDALDVVRQRLIALLGPPYELAMELVGHVTDLDHLRHVATMPHVLHMFKWFDKRDYLNPTALLAVVDQRACGELIEPLKGFVARLVDPVQRPFTGQATLRVEPCDERLALPAAR